MIPQYLIILLSAAVLAILQTTILAFLSQNLQLDFIFVIVVLIGLYKDPVHGSILTALLGLGEDIISGNMAGLFMTSRICVFIAAQVLKERLSPDTPLAQFMIALGLGVFDRVVLLLLQELFTEPLELSGTLLLHMVLGVLVNAALIPLFYFLFCRIPGFIELPRGPRVSA